ncbi:MAG: TolB family protein [Planctomycetota bacterium]|jgi:dipeptidyl aminopeptidase/acylaminoacyl peptidase
MDTQKAKKVGYSKASIALVAALSCLLIYILACVLSPPTWSPDSSKIAILVTPPGDDPDMFAIFTYDIATGERILLDEVEKNGVLSAPAWSPDGKWIAYYKVEPSPPEKPACPPEADPNATASTDKSMEKACAKIEVEKAQKKGKEKVTAQEPFSEENKMLTPFLLDIVKEKLAEEEEDLETFDVKLIVVRPDGKERKFLRVMKWQGDKDDRQWLVYIRPEWSPDSGDIFYAHVLYEAEVFYISSLDLNTGKTQAHLFSSIGTPTVSPDGKWVASLLEVDSEKTLLTVSRIDGGAQKYFKLDPDFESGETALFPMIWLPDSKHILIPAKEEFWLVDAETGDRQKLSDPTTDKIGYPVISAVDNKLYYLAGYESDDPNASEQTITFKCMNLDDRKTRTVFQLSNFPETSDGGILSISPNGKMVLMRCVMEHESGKDKSALIFWDGTTRKIVETDRWLMKPLYSEEDLIFEKKLIGKWKDEDGETSVFEGTEEKTYKIIVIEKGGDKYHFAAHLIKLKGMMFMGIFLDESVLQKKDSYGSHLLPDGFMKVDQIEPKLLLREMVDYDELAEMLKKPPESLKQEAEVDYALEAIRVQPKDSNAPAERN